MSKGYIVVDQKLKLRWLVSAMTSVLVLSSVSTAQASSHHRRAAHSASAKALAKSKKAASARKSAASTRLHSARHGNVVRTLATAEPLINSTAQFVPVSVSAAPASKIIVPSPSMSAASGASFGQIYGLHHTVDPLDLKSSVALVMDQDTNEVLLSKNSDAVLPIASLTKLMTATVVVEARQSMDEVLTITDEDVDTEKNSSSRLSVGTSLTRGEALHLALMSSENRAAHALGRAYPGGLGAFVLAMNAKAHQLGMNDTHYVDPTGLNSKNQSSAKDLAVLVKAAYQQTIIRELSTSTGYALSMGRRQVQFHNTNSLVKNPTWDIGLQKTGYIVEAGRCLVLQASMAGRKLIMVFLDSTGKYSRQADAERVRRWIEKAGGGRQHGVPSPPTAVVVSAKATS